MAKISKFQIIVLGSFLLFIIIGVAAFATYRGSDDENTLPPVTIWGTFPKQWFDAYLSKVNLTMPAPLSVSYVQKSEQAFLGDFTSALARGAGPDGILIPADLLLASRDKLQTVPYDVLPQRDFMQMFIDEGRVYLSSSGILGLPFAVDPLVMYWNRDLYNTAGIAKPADTWDDLTPINSRIVVKDDNGTISRSGVALGDFTNVINAREILGALFLQLGNPVTKEFGQNDMRSTLQPSGTASPVPALNFFTEFVNPASDNYSWNRSWPDSRTAFIAGKLGTYFGFASELFALQDKNPNLNFDVAPLPQNENAESLATYGKLYGFSITKTTPYANPVFQVMYILTLPENLRLLSADTYLPSVSRSGIASGSTDPYLTVFNEQALISRTWLDADPQKSANLMGQMVSSITSGQKSTYQALSDFNSQYDVLLLNALGY